ncbi:MAG: hypothetical protein JWO22_4157 [Frankiales bacterium]|nr:hypothetical protein [Frankiales bacterium]
MSEPGVQQSEIDAAVRRYLGRLAGRYVPVAAAVVALVLVVTFTPSTSPTPSSSGLGLDGGTSGAPLDGGATGATTGAVPGTTTGGSAPVASGTGGTTGTTGAVLPGGSTGTTTPGTTGAVTPPVTNGGVSRAGVACRPGAKQVPWTVYSPPCVAAYRGSNGGASSYGVTGSTITLSYRLGNSASDAAIAAATGAAAPPRDTAYLQDLNTYLAYFNKQYELYGRKVVIKSFQGQGDYIQEDQGQGGPQAQADGQTARGLGAFGDVTFQLRGSNPYWGSLAQQKVVAWGPLGFPDSYYQRNAPYWWSITPSGTGLGSWMGNLTCQRLDGMKAIFAPDKTLAAKQRVFGLVHPDNPEYVNVANVIKGVLKRCGAKITREVTYSINVAQFQTQSQSIVAQMQAAGVTTMLCYCDPVVPIFLGNSAQSQNYYPEWVQPYWGDGQAQQPYGGNWRGLMTPAGAWPTDQHNEAYRVFKKASGGKEPAEIYYAAAYGTLLQVFLGLQVAGPQLTPANLARGSLALPDVTGYLGTFQFQHGHAYTPVSAAPVGWFDPTYTSPFDDVKGGYRNCDNGALHSFTDPSTWGGPHLQLHCFGQ